MTWHHVAAILFACLMVISCGLSEKCTAASFPHVVSLAMAIVAGAFGHAGAQGRAVRKTDPTPDETSGRVK